VIDHKYIEFDLQGTCTLRSQKNKLMVQNGSVLTVHMKEDIYAELNII